jgi:hypothetical protein
MAVKGAQAKSGWHLIVRVLGATGLLVAGVGLNAYAATGKEWGLELAIGGAVAVALALLVEVRGIVALAFSRRGALGFNVFLQILLAAALLAGVNAFAFSFYHRFDLTRDQEFTIPQDIQEQLSKLSGETRIVLFQRHTSFGQLADKQDNYDAAAERQIVAKVKDLVEQFRELGPRFRVELLDIQEEGYQDKLAALNKEAPALAKAIDEAPENSVFFYAGQDKVQRLSFHDIYQLDKQESKAANDKRGNLILLYQGIGPFARKVLNIEEKRPRVALGVVHEVLGLENKEEGSRDIGMTGARKALVSHGFQTRDIILKKWTETAPPEPAILTQDESKFERLEEQLIESDATIKGLEKEISVFRNLANDWQTKALKELRATDFAKRLDVDEINEQVRGAVLKQILLPNLKLRELGLKQERQERDALLKEKIGLNVENLAEQRRISDLRAKFNRLLADADLLIVPRMTLLNVARGDRIPNAAHKLDDAQIESIKEFMRAGKPVLFCLGPTNEQAGRIDPSELGGDRLEMAVTSLGFQLPKQTILFNVESKALAERRSGLFFVGTPVEVPPVQFEWPPGADMPAVKKAQTDLAPNPIRVSMEITAASVDKSQSLDLRLRHPRPVYFEPRAGVKQKVDPIFMVTSAEAWNEEQPFPSRERTPRFELPKPDDPDRGTVREKRRGNFPIGAAVETELPVFWQESGKGGPPGKVRVAVIGHGGVFMGPTLTPVKEKLLLDVCNWLLGRDDLLATRTETWQFPRVSLTDEEFQLWHWGTRWEAVLFAFIGLVVWMVRRMR